MTNFFSPAKVCVESGTHPLDADLGKRALEKLYKDYPGWDWRVDVPPDQNALIVRNYTCDPTGKYGFFIRKTVLYSDPSMRNIMRAGGEFLEQYRQRARAKDDARVPYRGFRLELPELYKLVRPNGRRRP